MTDCCGSTCQRQSEYHSQCRDDCPWDWDCAHPNTAHGADDSTQDSWWCVGGHCDGATATPKNPFAGVSLQNLESDPKVQSLLTLLKVVAIVLALACCSFIRIRLKAMLATAQARQLRGTDDEEEAMDMIRERPTNKLARTQTRNTTKPKCAKSARPRG